MDKTVKDGKGKSLKSKDKDNKTSSKDGKNKKEDKDVKEKENEKLKNIKKKKSIAAPPRKSNNSDASEVNRVTSPSPSPVAAVESVIIESARNSRGKSHETATLSVPAIQTKNVHFHDVEGEETAMESVEDIWGIAWNICSERFHRGNGPLSVSLELRDTWLRIMEAEWLDVDISVLNLVLPSKIFNQDRPPLALALDFWSRGALEVFPNERRESILDTFLSEDKTVKAGSLYDGNKMLGIEPFWENEAVIHPQKQLHHHHHHDNSLTGVHWFDGNTEDIGAHQQEQHAHEKVKTVILLSEFKPLTDDIKRISKVKVVKPKVFLTSRGTRGSKGTVLKPKLKGIDTKVKEKIRKSKQFLNTSEQPELLTENHLPVFSKSFTEVMDKTILRSQSQQKLSTNSQTGETTENIIDQRINSFTINSEMETLKETIPTNSDRKETENLVHFEGSTWPPRVHVSQDAVFKSFETVLQARLIESKSSLDINEQYRRFGLKAWSPSDCGGRKGRLGVFHLPRETTDEAIERTNSQWKKNRGTDSFSSTFNNRKSVSDRLILDFQETGNDNDDYLMDILNPSEIHRFDNLRPASFEESELKTDWIGVRTENVVRNDRNLKHQNDYKFPMHGEESTFEPTQNKNFPGHWTGIFPTRHDHVPEPQKDHDSTHPASHKDHESTHATSHKHHESTHPASHKDHESIHPASHKDHESTHPASHKDHDSTHPVSQKNNNSTHPASKDHDSTGHRKNHETTHSEHQKNHETTHSEHQKNHETTHSEHQKNHETTHSEHQKNHETTHSEHQKNHETTHSEHRKDHFPSPRKQSFSAPPKPSAQSSVKIHGHQRKSHNEKSPLSRASKPHLHTRKLHPKHIKLTKSKKVLFDNKLQTYRTKIQRQNELNRHSKQYEDSLKMEGSSTHPEIHTSEGDDEFRQKVSHLQSHTSILKQKAIIKRHSDFALYKKKTVEKKAPAVPAWNPYFT